MIGYFQAGFPHFSIDSTSVNNNGGTYETSVFIRHRKHQAPNYYNNVPLTVGFYDAQFNRQVYKLNFTGRCMELKVNLGFDPKMIVIDPEEKISDAITENEEVISAPVVKLYNESKVRTWIKNVKDPSDSSLLRIEHNWIAPDRFITNPGNGFVLNDKRYWTVHGINLENLEGLIQFFYDGSANDNFIDSSWIQNSEDSIRLFYRSDAAQNWAFANDSLRAFSLSDKRGSVYLKEIKAGEYCFGIQRSNYTDPLTSDLATGPCGLATNLTETPSVKNQFAIYPNPTSSYVIISSATKFKGQLRLLDLNGKVIFQRVIELDNHLQRIQFPELSEGLYLLNLVNERTSFSKKIVVKH